MARCRGDRTHRRVRKLGGAANLQRRDALRHGEAVRVGIGPLLRRPKVGVAAAVLVGGRRGTASVRLYVVVMQRDRRRDAEGRRALQADVAARRRSRLLLRRLR